jgi:N-acetylglucosaminyldiphosphoundecaprenol N-acetyl-beta-D-mannosaminyltransferase
MAVEARLNPKIAESVNNATIVTSDGMSVVMALKYIHKIKQDRSAGMDMIFDLLNECRNQNKSIFLFGNDQETLSAFIEKAQKEYHGINICGALSPSYDQFTKEENDYYIEQINKAKPDIVFVSLGCPKQELWMAENTRRINSVLLGIGGAMTLYAKKVKRAPVFMQKNGLEWLYRLIQEPKRLWKRYLITNTLFIYYFFKQLISKR